MLKKAFTIAAAVAGLSLVGSPAFALGGGGGEQNDDITVAFVQNTEVTYNTNIGEGNIIGKDNETNNVDDSFNTQGINNEGGFDKDHITFGWAAEKK